MSKIDFNFLLSKWEVPETFLEEPDSDETIISPSTA